MKYGTLLAGLLCLFFAAGCEDSITIKGPDGDRFEVDGLTYGYLRDLETQRTERTVELRTGETLSVELFMGITQSYSTGVDFQLRVDPTYAKVYNEAHNTKYTLYPAYDRVRFEQDGAVVIAPGDTRSDALTLEIADPGNLEAGKTYILPVAVDAVTEQIQVSADASHFVLLIRNAADMPDPTKGDVKTILYFEVNDANPLNALEFTMADSGKPFWDIVILFAANINYDQTTQRVFLNNNENVQYLLDNREQFVRPLQEAGIKVLLGVLGNHDEAGLSKLSPELAHEFAQELKAYCEAYGLDGVNFDNEYSTFPATLPGLVAPSAEAAARLCYETKRAMPDKLVSVFCFDGFDDRTNSESKGLGFQLGFDYAFDGMLPGDYIDIAMPNYGWTIEPTIFKGMSYKQCAGHALELNRPAVNESDLAPMLEKGYGYQMDFALNPSKYNVQVPALQRVARALYGEELNAPTHYYGKNSTTREPLSSL